ncbi:uncharacterized protein LOC120821736 [Gasterosteus aculeatus]
MTGMTDTTDEKPTVLVLSLCLIGLLLLLFFFYKMLNREAKGEYTVRRLVYKDGGVRDRVRGASLALGTRLGVRLWPWSDADEDGEEMREVEDEEGQLEEGGSQSSDSEGDGGEDGEQCSTSKGEEDDGHRSSDYESSEAGELDRITDQGEARGTGEKVGDGECKGEASGGAGVLIDLKKFSGSAIWSEEEGGGRMLSDVTAL